MKLHFAGILLATQIVACSDQIIDARLDSSASDIELGPSPTLSPDPTPSGNPVVITSSDQECVSKVKKTFACEAPLQILQPSELNVAPKITGYAYLDLNKNGTRDAGEVGAVGAYPYIDVNNNCVYDNGDVKASSLPRQQDGYYEIAGKIKVIQNNIPIFEPNSMPIGALAVRISAMPFTQYYVGGHSAYGANTQTGSVYRQANFAMAAGDPRSLSTAPTTYGQASHKIRTDMILGDSINQGSAKACGENDGVVFPSTLKFGAVNTISVRHNGSLGFLRAWIDFNADGDFDDPGEFVIGSDSPNGVTIYRNANQGYSVTFPQSSGGKSVQTWARFRLGLTGMTATGESNGGEVEDYLVTIQQ